MKEIWKDIENYKGYYQVSNMGNVRSLDRVVKTSSGDRKYKGKLLTPHVGRGYLHVVLCRDGVLKTRAVHKLVAIYFLGHNPCGFKMVVDHIDNNPINNRYDNLQIITQRENTTKIKRGVSKYVGVYWDKKYCKWISTIRNKKRRHYLGAYDSQYEAHLAYQQKLLDIRNG